MGTKQQRICETPGCGKPALARQHRAGSQPRLFWDRDHTLCEACFRNQMNSQGAAVRGVEERGRGSGKPDR